MLRAFLETLRMNNAASSIVSQLDLEQVELNLFRGQSENLGTPRVFGGQVIGQALVAALRTVSERHCHSLHGYFLRPGDPNKPILYEVDRIRDGKSFATRRVVAIQSGEAIFNMACSFQVLEDGLSHARTMPDVPKPDDLPDERELIVARIDVAARGDARDDAERKTDRAQTVEAIDYANPKKMSPKQHTWFRAKYPLGDDVALHQCMLAYASDMGILSTCTLPHGRSFMTGLMTASLDHAMWFHRPFSFDEWILFEQDSPASGGARGFNRGTMYTEQGVLVASVAQEGLIRDVARGCV